MSPVISVVLPVCNEEQVLSRLYERLTSVMRGLGEAYELIFIDDGSRDRSLTLLKELREKDTTVKIINLSRNFGHQAAITCGLDYAKGDAVVVMDADLQDPPELIPELITQWREGYDVVYAVREKREGESVFKSVTAELFYRVIKKLARIEIPVDTGDFRLLSRRAANALKSTRERSRFIRGLVSWVGYRQTGVKFVRQERFAGQTKYPFRKMLKFAIDGITAFSFVPLQMATYCGFLISGVSFLYIVYAVLQKLLTNRPVTGWTSLIVAMLFLGGVQLIMLGIIGEYIGRIYEEVKQRPLYLVDETFGFESEPGEGSRR
ncbi:MAG: glycosyltransferase family 2 protein [Candidatus Methylomirabilis oxyfera]|nr:glycosyltransferase family 2 protein [Candidatus Methylomirabilis oxyfera]